MIWKTLRSREPEDQEGNDSGAECSHRGGYRELIEGHEQYTDL